MTKQCTIYFGTGVFYDRQMRGYTIISRAESCDYNCFIVFNCVTLLTVPPRSESEEEEEEEEDEEEEEEEEQL